MNMLSDLTKLPKPTQLSSALEGLLAWIDSRFGQTQLNTRSIPLSQCDGEILARDLIAPIDLPYFRQAAMDGYAIHTDDLATLSHSGLMCSSTLLAGQAWNSEEREPSRIVRIMTGAAVPQQFNVVIMQEHCVRSANSESSGLIQLSAEFATGYRPGKNIRQQGEDIAQGQRVIASGQRLRPGDLAVAGALGIAQLETIKPLIVGLASTGDEVCEPGTPRRNVQSYDANRSALIALLARQGHQVLDLGIVRDDPERLQQLIHQATQQCDALVLSGGASGGAADYTCQVLAQHGEACALSLAMRPGKPLVVGAVSRPNQRDLLVLGLPGNPVAACVSCTLVAKPLLQRLAGQSSAPSTRLLAQCERHLRKPLGRTDILRAHLITQTREGFGPTPSVTPFDDQGAAALHSFSQANCFLIMDEQVENIKPGDFVTVMPFDGL